MILVQQEPPLSIRVVCVWRVAARRSESCLVVSVESPIDGSVFEPSLVIMEFQEVKSLNLLASLVRVPISFRTVLYLRF